MPSIIWGVSLGPQTPIDRIIHLHIYPPNYFPFPINFFRPSHLSVFLSSFTPIPNPHARPTNKPITSHR